jgi:hypothetical protein
VLVGGKFLVKPLSRYLPGLRSSLGLLGLWLAATDAAVLEKPWHGGSRSTEDEAAVWADTYPFGAETSKCPAG